MQTTNQSSKRGLLKIFTSVFAISGGIISGILGAIGALGWCCVPLAVAVLGFFGISGAWLMTYNKILLGIGVILMGLAGALLILRRKTEKCGECPSHSKEKTKERKIYQCPECGLRYPKKRMG